MLLLLGLETAFAQSVAPIQTGGVAPIQTDGTWVIPEWTDQSPNPVVGGEHVEIGSWEDTVGIVFDYGFYQYVGCTGTLIDEKVVLTAGHCVVGASIGYVLTANTDWTKSQANQELIEVDGVFEYPNSQTSFDVGLLTLAKKSSVPPRALALDCIIDDYLVDGAEVTVVGYGVTDEDGYDRNTAKNVGVTLVEDADCSQNKIDGMSTGCNVAARPAGEIAAGGNGVDACFGDSGGPLYLRTPEGDFVVGVVSRAYIGVDPDFPCRDGGIYVRPDAVIDWIEETVGHPVTYPSCNVAPEVSAPDIATVVDTAGSTTLVIADGDGDPANATVEITVAPEFGSAELGDGGVITYTPDPGFEGADSLTVTVTDEGAKPYKLRSGAPLAADAVVEIWVEGAGLFDAAEPGATQCECGALSMQGVGAWGGLLPLLLARRLRGRRPSNARG